MRNYFQFSGGRNYTHTSKPLILRTLLQGNRER